MSYQLAVIGAGVMAEAIVRGLLNGAKIPAGVIVAADISAERRQFFQSVLGVAAVENPAEAAAGAKTILLSVKPYQIESVLKGLAGAIDEKTLIVSIAAGIGSGFIEEALGQEKKWRVIRAMPNTPMLVGKGMVAIARGTNASADDLAAARAIFESAAKVIEVSEEKIDAVTAVSGSGPAYYFYLTEQLIRAGVELGLSDQEAQTLAIQTAAGAAEMMSRLADSPGEHRRRVTTPNGTTHAAISHLDEKKWSEITVEAVKAAARRSRELGK
jgi:pyrroline-5-carboxylate reductase